MFPVFGDPNLGPLLVSSNAIGATIVIWDWKKSMPLAYAFLAGALHFLR